MQGIMVRMDQKDAQSKCRKVSECPTQHVVVPLSRNVDIDPIIDEVQMYRAVFEALFLCNEQ